MTVTPDHMAGAIAGVLIGMVASVLGVLLADTGPAPQLHCYPQQQVAPESWTCTAPRGR